MPKLDLLSGVHTSTTVQPKPVTVEDVVRMCEELASEPRCIGELMGCPVFVDPTVSPGEIVIKSPDQELRFSVDHRYIRGTKIERAARLALGL
jgi:hypothetical protein